MRFSVFAVLSCVATLATVIALPVEDWKPKHSEVSPDLEVDTYSCSILY